MGKLRSWQYLNPLFSSKYKRLLDEYGSKDYSKLLIQESLEDYISYNCGHCGHIQKLQAEELNSIVGHAFRLAYAAHLQKTGATLLDAKDTTRKTRKQRSRPKHTPNPTPDAHRSESTDSHFRAQSPSSCCSSLVDGSRSSHFSYHSSKEDIGCESSLFSSDSSQNCAIEHDAAMRTPCHSQSTPPKPTSLPVLRYCDTENNLFLSPDSDTSNSPTELNCSKRLTDKPSVIKNVNLNEPNVSVEQFEHNISCAVTSQQPLISNISFVTETNPTHKIEDKKQKSEPKSLKSKLNQDLKIDVCAFEKLLPPPLPERCDSLVAPEESHLRIAPWFQAGIPREIALEVLSREPVGAFMVRESTSKPGCYALSLRVPRDFTVSGIAHYLIVTSSKGYKIKGFTKEFPNLTALITHHSVMPELLPCPLSLSRYNPTFNADNEPNEDDPDYNTLSDFRKMMSDLNV